MPSVGASCFDASALVKIYIPEYDSDAAREYFQLCSPTKYTTPFCFFEDMNVLKSKWLYQKQLTQTQYNDAAWNLMAWYEPSPNFQISTSDIH